jgi:phenylalanyl-tRNA synthetase beta chain
LSDLSVALKQLGGELLVAADLFDVYTGQQVGAGRKSAAFALTFRSAERTLTDTEINEVMDRIVRGLGEKFGAAIR